LTEESCPSARNRGPEVFSSSALFFGVRHGQRERIFIELMTSDRKVKASREGSKSGFRGKGLSFRVWSLGGRVQGLGRRKGEAPADDPMEAEGLQEAGHDRKARSARRLAPMASLGKPG